MKKKGAKSDPAARDLEKIKYEVGQEMGINPKTKNKKS